LISKPNSSSQK